MNNYCELQVTGILYPEQIICQFEMPAAADRQKLGKTLDYTKNNRFPNTHSLFLFRFFLFAFTHYGIAHESESAQDDDRRDL